MGSCAATARVADDRPPLRGELAAAPPTTDLQTEPQRCNRLILFKVPWSERAGHPERVGQCYKRCTLDSWP